MRRRGYELTDFKWPMIEPLLLNKPRGGLRSGPGVDGHHQQGRYGGDIVMIDSSCVCVYQHQTSDEKGLCG